MICGLSYSGLTITGDCSNTNSGSFYFDINGTAPDYTINWISPSGGTSVALGAGITNYSLSGLSAGTYSLQIIDSCVPNTVLPLNIYISSGTCAQISSSINTTCGLNNGSLTVTSSNLYSSADFILYATNSGATEYITSGTSLTNTYTFGSLSAGTYYAIVNDGGGCTGSTQTCNINTSSTLDFGLYTINDSACTPSPGSGMGAIYVTGLTGSPPYTYLWSNGATTSSITGLTAGAYSVIVTDYYGCSTSKASVISTIAPLGLGLFYVDTTPTCSGADGVLTLTITGGTAPYYYAGSNGQTDVTYSTNYTFTGLSSGYFTVTVTDAALCSITESYLLLTPGSFSVVSVTHTNATCQNSNGTISVTLVGGATPYTLTLFTTTGTQTITTSSPTYNFTSLPPGNYVLTITDAGGICSFDYVITINSTFYISSSINVNDTTCNLDNGSIDITVSGGTAPYTFSTSRGDNSGPISSTGITFNSFASGSYTATVVDSLNCQQITPFTIALSSTVDFVLSPTNPYLGNNGLISLYITDGTPPFSYVWSDNVNGQTGTTVSGLSAGTYTLLLSDVNGCSLTKTVVLSGVSIQSSYQIYSICTSSLVNSGQAIKGIKQMLNQGYQSYISGQTGCTLTSAKYTAIVTINGVSSGNTFYTGYTLNDLPSNSQWGDSLVGLINSFSGVSSAMVSLVDNTLTILSNCSTSTNILSGAIVEVSLQIDYEINCDLVT